MKTRRTSICSWWTRPIPPAPTGRKSFRQSDGILKGAGIVDGKILAQYEKNASSQLKLFDLEGKALGDIELPGIGSIEGLGGRWDRKEVFFGFQSFTVPPSVYQVELASRKTSLWDKVATPGIDPSAYEVTPGLVHVERRHQGPDVRLPQKGIEAERQESRRCSPATAGST